MLCHPHSIPVGELVGQEQKEKHLGGGNRDKANLVFHRVTWKYCIKPPRTCEAKSCFQSPAIVSVTGRTLRCQINK